MEVPSFSNPICNPHILKYITIDNILCFCSADIKIGSQSLDTFYRLILFSRRNFLFFYLFICGFNLLSIVLFFIYNFISI